MARKRRKRLDGWDRIKPFLDALHPETPRTWVILTAAAIDTMLEDLLRQAMAPSLSADGDLLLDQQRPLGTFSARIEAAYRFRLIDADFRRALDLLRKLRNDAAHEYVGLSDHPSWSDQARAFVAHCRASEVVFQLGIDVAKQHAVANQDQNSRDLLNSLVALACHLEITSFNKRWMTGPIVFTEKFPEWDEDGYEDDY